jgi:hypothetical protein
MSAGESSDGKVVSLIERSRMASKDKNSKKSMEKKKAQKTLKEKRQAKKDKK